MKLVKKIKSTLGFDVEINFIEDINDELKAWDFCCSYEKQSGYLVNLIIDNRVAYSSTNKIMEIALNTAVENYSKSVIAKELELTY